MANEFDNVLNLGFRVHVPNLMHEIADCGLDRRQGALKIPMQVMMKWLGDVAQRASEIDDPQLNIIMLSMGMYEVPPEDSPKLIEEQFKRINSHEKEKSSSQNFTGTQPSEEHP